MNAIEKTLAVLEALEGEPTVRLADVAAQADLSRPTAHRILQVLLERGYAERVGSSYRAKARDGRASAHQRTSQIGFLIADPIGSVYEDLFFNEVLRGVATELEPHDFHAVVAPLTAQSQQAELLPSVLTRVDGVIAGGIDLQDQAVRGLRDGPVPVVFVGRYLEGRGLNSILPNNQEGARLATEQLLSEGRHNVAMIGGPADRNIFFDRTAGFRQAHGEADLEPNQSLIRYTERTPEGGLRAGLDLLEHDGGPKAEPDAIFAADDWIAVGVLRALRLRGRRIPDDIAVMGYGDIPIAAAADPPLSTVHVPKRRLGRAAAKLLLDLIHDDIEGPVQMLVSPHIVHRETTAPPAQLASAGQPAASGLPSADGQ